MVDRPPYKDSKADMASVRPSLRRRSKPQLLNFFTMANSSNVSSGNFKYFRLFIVNESIDHK